MNTTRGASYIVAVALMLALTPLITALPAAAAPCDPVGGIVPALICPAPPNRPRPTATPAPTASPTVVPAPPLGPPVTAPAPRPPDVPAAPASQPVAPATGPGSLPPAEVPPTAAAPAAFIPTAPGTAPGPVAVARPTSDDRGGRGVTGAILLAAGGLMVMVWASVGLRKTA